MLASRGCVPRDERRSRNLAAVSVTIELLYENATLSRGNVQGTRDAECHRELHALLAEI